MKNTIFKKCITFIYVVTIALLTLLFFTNDFGLTDIRKTSVVVGVGIDIVDEQVKVTAQIAVPQPSESGENTTFTQIEGEGQTVGDALTKVNAKAGFNPKLIFCKLILLGESCKERDVFALLDYFYRNEYTQLTPIVAMCKGEAGQLLGQQLPFGDTATVSIERLLSDEAKRSGSVSTVNLKCLGLLQNSPSKCCFMPYIQVASPTESEGGQEEGGAQSAQGGQEGQGTQSVQQVSQQTEYSCSQTVIFRDGKYCLTLDDEQAFALNLLRNEIRHTFVTGVTQGEGYTLGLRSCKGKVGLKVEDGVPKLTLGFKGRAQIKDLTKASSPQKSADRVVSEQILQNAQDTLKGYFEKLVDVMRETDCDLLGVKQLLYRFHYNSFLAFGDTLLQQMQVEYDFTITSSA